MAACQLDGLFLDCLDFVFEVHDHSQILNHFQCIFLGVSAGVLLPLTARQSTINPEAVTLNSQHERFKHFMSLMQQSQQSESSFGPLKHPRAK